MLQSMQARQMYLTHLVLPSGIQLDTISETLKHHASSLESLELRFSDEQKITVRFLDTISVCSHLKYLIFDIEPVFGGEPDYTIFAGRFDSLHLKSVIFRVPTYSRYKAPVPPKQESAPSISPPSTEPEVSH